MKRIRIIILGATGSIGRQAREVALAEPERFEVVGLAAGKDAAGLFKAARAFPRARLALAEKPESSFPCPLPPDFLSGSDALQRLIRESDADIVVNGVSGAAGLVPSIVALESGKDLALANKESVVMAWPLLTEAAARSGRKIIPVDSEHAALFQLLERIVDAEEVTITASGGAFRDLPLERLADMGPDDAAAHPSWKMGRKISIDSATMANKGLEVIEAARLFGVEGKRIKVLVHPQSLVHALVRAKDGSLFANISAADMRLPIRNALVYPERGPCPFGRLELEGQTLEFRPAGRERYPLLALAYDALSSGYGATVAYNAADEVAVASFEAGEIGFLDIHRVVGHTLDRHWEASLGSVELVFAADSRAREIARQAVKEIR